MFKKTLLATALIALGGFATVSMAATNPATGSFNVKLKIHATCNVTAAPGAASDIDFGDQDANPTANLQGQNLTSIKVNCSKSTKFVINLTPSSTSSTTGAGTMASVPAGDTVPYQLRQATGMTGAVWGNTGTVTAGVPTVGNGVGGTGAGVNNAIIFPVYATVTSTDYLPATYSDLVNVSVVY